MSLIKEFAIEPKVMAKWEHFNSLWEDFGVGKGRLISKYPPQWRQKVDEELAKNPIGDIHTHSIKSKIWAGEHKFLVNCRTYAGTMDWLSKACAQMSMDPFHAIIACENPNAGKAVLVAGEFAKDEPPFQITTLGWNWVPRKAEALANCASLLLNHCEAIRFVDPHFDPDTTGLRFRYKNTFEAMLSVRYSNAPKLRILEIHRRRPEGFVAAALHMCA